MCITFCKAFFNLNTYRNSFDAAYNSKKVAFLSLLGLILGFSWFSLTMRSFAGRDFKTVGKLIGIGIPVLISYFGFGWTLLKLLDSLIVGNNWNLVFNVCFFLLWIDIIAI